MTMIAVYDWSNVTSPDMTTEQLESARHPNDPSFTSYNQNDPSWTNRTYTYSGSDPILISVSDDDDILEDDRAETGNAAVLAKDVVLNGNLYRAGTEVSTEFSLLDESGAEVWVINIGGVNVGMVPQSPYTSIPAGSRFTPTQARDYDTAWSTDGQTSEELYRNVACFTAGTMIATPQGQRRAGSVRPGQFVLTRDHGPQPVLWTGRSTVQFDGPDDPRRPIRFQSGTLSQLQTKPLVVSPQHRILILDSHTGHRAFVPALGLLPLAGVSRIRGRECTTYVHLLLPRHGVLNSNGAATESFLPGEFGVTALDDCARDRLIRALGPGGIAGYGPTAYPCWTRGQTVRRLGHMGQLPRVGETLIIPSVPQTTALARAA